MSDWIIRLTYNDLDPSIEEMISWEEQLHEYDGHASRPRLREIEVTVHAPAYMDIWDAGRKLSDVVEHVVGAKPVGVEVITEDELYRRANQPTMPELMSATEIAEELGVARQRVHQLRATAAFPAPLAELRGGSVWDAAAVRKFARDWERKPGRPRKPW